MHENTTGLYLGGRAPAAAPEATARCILFVDCDRFFFSVEAAETPELASDPRPIAIGHDPREAPRAIVTTANDAARVRGIRSGMSAARARKLAPDVVFLPPRRHLYERYSARVMAILNSVSPLVQQNSIDEAACLWPAGFEVEPARELRERILTETQLSVSIGIAASPLVAKMASEVAKSSSDHICIVRPGEEAAFLAPHDVRSLIGVGPRAEQRLRERGIATIGDLAARPLPELVADFGRAYGKYLHDASRGIDDSELHTDRVAKSISDEHTFSQDTTDRRLLWRQLRSQAESVARRLHHEGLQALEVGIKVRYADWETFTRQMRLSSPTDDAVTLASGAAALMRRHWDPRRPVRLIGLRAARLTPPSTYVQLRLFDLDAPVDPGSRLLP